MSMDVYAKAKPDLLRDAAEASAGRLKDALAAAACCTGVAQGKSENTTAAVRTSQQRRNAVLKEMGDTGLEPVTLSLSS
jgi:hypothetical protein